jgi:hypothetical protein
MQILSKSSKLLLIHGPFELAWPYFFDNDFLMKNTFTIIVAILFQFKAAFAAEVVGSGELVSSQPAVQAKGSIQIVEESDGTHVVGFSNDYLMSSGVVLDLKLCGIVLESSPPVCLSQGEVRKLKGGYQMKVRFPLLKYQELKIYDLDLSQEHAHATLSQ